MKKKIPVKINPIMEEVKNKLREIYGNRLKSIILYGSYARGNADEGSDIDLIILLENMDKPVTEMEKYSREIHSIDLEYDTLISAIPIDASQYRTRKLPLILNAKREGIIFYERAE